ncbi:MAG: hypothetical protein RL205_1329 [Actinomycetota bacterium]
MSTPDLSIVLISFNDAKRLPRALRSLSRQTLSALEIIVVDDASTDNTADVVAKAAAADPRIRYVRLDQNSGGCSAPRNRGIAEAIGRWVMFCDSDDEYERHAAKNLLLAVEAADADLGCGVVERVDSRTGKHVRWREDSHDSAVLETIEDRLELIYDTVSVNKIYRRQMLLDHGIRFPEGILYEDQLFTMEAFVRASRIAVIPQTVYYWNVDRVSDDLSITQRRREVRNVSSRVSVNRLIDAFLAEQGSSELRAAKALKFLSHDLYLYLAVILDVDDSTARSLVDELLPYVSQVDLSGAERLRPLLKVAVYHLLIGDVEGIRRAMRFIKWSASVDGTVQMREGRELWVCSSDHAVDEIGGHSSDWWLDVTVQGISRVPVTQRRYCHQLADVAEGTELLSGSSADYLDSLADVDAISLVAVREGRVIARAAAVLEQVAPLHWEWRALESLCPVTGISIGDRGTLAIELVIGDLVNMSILRASDVRTGTTLPLRLGLGRVEGLHLESRDFGAVGWRVIRRSPLSLAGAGIRRAWFAIPGTRSLASAWRRLRVRSLPRLAAAIGSRLPVTDAVVLSCDHGRGYGGHPRAISEYLAVAEPALRQYWIDTDGNIRLPQGVHRLDTSTMRGAWILSRAGLWIDDFGIDPAVRMNSRTRYLQTWHGIALKRVGSDAPDWGLTPAKKRRPLAANRTRWDALISPSEYFAGTTARAIGFDGVLVDDCTPFGDAVIAASLRPDLRARLDLPSRRMIVMYSPTLSAQRTGESKLDLEAWWRAFGDRAYLLIRSHPADPLSVPARWNNAMRDISGEDDLASFLAASDALITDYNSVLFDFARLRRPVGFLAPDYDEFTRRTVGLYLDLERSAPGPVLRDNAALHAWVNDVVEGRDNTSAQRREDFVSMFAGEADGTGSARAMQALRGLG